MIAGQAPAGQPAKAHRAAIDRGERIRVLDTSVGEDNMRRHPRTSTPQVQRT